MKSENNTELSIIIPAFNEEANIIPFIRELTKVAKKIQISRYEILVIDDHSEDGTFEKIENLARSNIKALRLSRRSGSHTAIRAGLTLTKGDIVLCVSADGQDDPNVLPRMIEKIKKGTNIVWAARNERNEPFLSKLIINIFYQLLKWFTDYGMIDKNLSNIDFYLLDRKVVDAINEFKEKNTSLLGLLIWLGFKQDYVYYVRRNRISGNSKWNVKSKLRFATDWIIAFSGIPLRMITIMGLSFSALAVLYAIFIFVYVLSGHAKPGWAEPVFLIVVTSGMQMTMLGVLGEYLWRNLDETRKRPLFFIEKKHNV